MAQDKTKPHSAPKAKAPPPARPLIEAAPKALVEYAIRPLQQGACILTIAENAGLPKASEALKLQSGAPNGAVFQAPVTDGLLLLAYDPVEPGTVWLTAKPSGNKAALEDALRHALSAEGIGVGKTKAAGIFAGDQGGLAVRMIVGKGQIQIAIQPR